MKFLENLDALLDFYKISKFELSKAIGISPSTITLWYKGNFEKINLDTIVSISKYFNVTMEELINGDVTTISFSLGDFTLAELHSIVKYSEFIKEQREELKNGDTKL